MVLVQPALPHKLSKHKLSKIVPKWYADGSVIGETGHARDHVV